MATTEPDPRTLVGFMSYEPATLCGLADAVLKRIRDNRGKTAAGSYVLGSPTGRVYVVAEGSSSGHLLIREFEHLLIGRYAATHRGSNGHDPVAYPTREDLAADLRFYYSDMA